MRLTRFYEIKPLDSAAIRAIRDLLSKSHGWGFAKASYTIYYPGEFFVIDTIDEVDKQVKSKGQPKDWVVYFTSEGGRTCNLDTRQGRVGAGMYLEVNNRDKPPEEILDSIEPVLSLKKIDEVPSDRTIKSAFVAHSFGDDGQSYAMELSRFLGLLGIKCQSGRGFAPKSVSEKVMNRLERHDILMAIVTDQDDMTWLTQELSTAHALKKSIFILKSTDADLKSGILGDHEYIAFPPKQLSRSFIPILEGLAELRGEESGYL